MNTRLPGFHTPSLRSVGRAPGVGSGGLLQEHGWTLAQMPLETGGHASLVLEPEELMGG